MAVNNKRGDYFEAPHYLSASKNSYPSAQHTGNPPVDVGSDNYDSEADRITEQELVPDIVERLSLRYGINSSTGVLGFIDIPTFLLAR